MRRSLGCKKPLPPAPRSDAITVTDRDGVGDPDGLDRLWTPHRMAYLRGQGKPADESVDQCPFCRAQGVPDADGLVVRRGSTAYVVLNLFPYAAGHLLICPYRHIADYTDASAEEVVEMAELTRQSMRVIRSVSAAQGFNIGMNQGAAGGAGIAAHLHQHVVPRWAGDANFLAVVGRTKAMPELLENTRALLADAWIDGGTAPGR